MSGRVRLFGGLLVALLLPGITAGSGDLRGVAAAKHGDRASVQSLLKQGIDVNARQADGATALFWAAYHDDLEMADLLIQHGADLSITDDYGATPIFLACTNGSFAMVSKLLEKGANPNAAASTGETPLMRCTSTGNLEAVKLLIAHRADVNAVESGQGTTALMRAAAGKHFQITAALIEQGANVNAHSKTGFTPLMFAAQQGDIESARRLLAAGAQVNGATPNGDTALLVASLSGHEALAIFLLENGADPNATERNGITALHYAMMKGLQQITDISPAVVSFAPYLFRENMTKLVKALLEHGANPNVRLIAPTRTTDSILGYGKIYRIDFLSPGMVNPVGATPFLIAAASYDANIMRMLAAAGADPLVPTEEGLTPLMAAAGLSRLRGRRGDLTKAEEQEALEAVQVALELGADVNAANELGLTALHGAAFCGLDSIVQFLSQKGANLDAKDIVGQTPLHKALNIKPAEGGVAANLVPNRMRKSTADLLLRLGATPVNAVAAVSNQAGG